MDFNDSLEETAFRSQVRQWLASHAPAFELPPNQPLNDDVMVSLARGWQACKAHAGYVGLAWSKAVGGQGASPVHSLIFRQEESHYKVPTILYAVGMGMCLPTVFTYLSAQVAQPLVQRAIKGEDVWCQLFSEPVAGSDLAGIRTRAERDNEDWIVTGQKVWTSYAHRSDYGLLLTRTDSHVPKHKGLTMFYVDMRSAGITVRPIRTLAGNEDFNEVFLTDVRVPDAQRLGDVGGGWNVALTTLTHERLAIGKPAEAPGVAELIALAASVPSSTGGWQIDNPAVRRAITQCYINDAGVEFIGMRAQTALCDGQQPGPEASVGKLIMAKTRQDVGAFALDLLGNGAVFENSNPAMRSFFDYYLMAAGLRIAGGTDEILRSVIAERVLGLPGDIRVDKTVPFNSVQ